MNIFTIVSVIKKKEDFSKIKMQTLYKKKKKTYNSNNTAQSGKNNRCVRPAPCIPINISELYVICNCSLKVK